MDANKAPNSEGSSGKVGTRTGTLILLSAAGTVLLFPPILGQLMSLTWKRGDVSPFFSAASGLALLVTLALVVLRARVDARLRAIPRREAALTAGLLVFMAVLCTGMLEVALHVVGPFRGAPPLSEAATAAFDRDTGWSYRHSRSSTITYFPERGAVVEHFDRWGSRVEAPDVHRDPKKPSILFVGCSFTMGHGLDVRDSVPGILAQDPEVPLQVVNLAVQSFGTDQSLRMLQRYIDTFDTRAVVYGFICDHIARNANADRRLLYPSRRFVGTKPRYHLAEGGGVAVLDEPHLYDEKIDPVLWRTLRFVWTAYGPQPSWELTRRLILEMGAVTRERQVPLVVVNWHIGTLDREVCNPGTFAGMDLDVLHTVDEPPEDWLQWRLPDDLHPDARANRHVAQRVKDHLIALGVLGGAVAVDDE